MEELLKKLVNTNSDSYNFKGISKNFDIILDELKNYSLNTEFVEGKGGHRSLIITNTCNDPKKRFLLIGHIDTVFPVNWAQYSKKGDYAFGPGVGDMKSGVVMIIKLLEEFKKSDSLFLQAIINSDEEIGSEDSKGIFKKYADKFDYGFVFEGAKENQGIIVKRKGIAEFKIRTKGKKAHAGTSFFEGKNAILSLIDKIKDIISEVKPLEKNGVTLNIAMIEGGEKLNIVPNLAKAYFDLRYINREDFLTVKNIFEKYEDESTEITIYDKRYPMNSEIEDAFLEKLKESYEKYGEKFSFDETGGASDGNFLSQFGLKVIDGLGPRGGGDHTENEYILYNSFENRLNALKDFFGNGK